MGASAITYNGERRSWDHSTPNGVIEYGAVHEWLIKGSRHPFHLHLYHMQIVGALDSSGRFTGQGCASDLYKIGEFYDVIDTAEDCLVRFRAIDISGRCVMHCHILSHEDNGSMGWVDVVGGPAPDNTNRDEVDCAVCGQPGDACGNGSECCSGICRTTGPLPDRGCLAAAALD